MSAEGQRITDAINARMGIARVAPAMINRLTMSRSAAMVLKTQQEIDTQASNEPLVCISIYAGNFKSLLKQGSNLHFRCVFSCPSGSCYHRGIHETVLLGLGLCGGIVGCGRRKIGNTNNELICRQNQKIETTYGVQIVLATQCLLWMQSLIITHCSGNQATTSCSQSFKASVQTKCCCEVAAFLLPEK